VTYKEEFARLRKTFALFPSECSQGKIELLDYCEMALDEVLAQRDVLAEELTQHAVPPCDRCAKKCSRQSGDNKCWLMLVAAKAKPS